MNFLGGLSGGPVHLWKIKANQITSIKSKMDEFFDVFLFATGLPDPGNRIGPVFNLVEQVQGYLSSS